jgi:hypothetical protein
MRTLTLFLAVALLAIFALGCSGPKTMQATSTGDVPEWFSNVPVNPNYLYAANTAVSQDLQLAIDKATTGARTEIGRQVEIKVNALQKRFEEETGVGQDAQLLQQFTQANKNVVSTSLSGTTVKTKSQVKDGDMWRAYVLVEYPIGQANAELLKAIKANEQMMTRFRASETYKELDTEVQKFDAFKKAQETK